MVKAENQADRFQEVGYVRSPQTRQFVTQVRDVLLECAIFLGGGIQLLNQVAGALLQRPPRVLFLREVAQRLREV